jgi:hypothetical protein
MLLNGLKLYDEGVRNEPLWRYIRDNTRVPGLVMGALEAQLASAELGVQRSNIIGSLADSREGSGVYVRWGVAPGERASRRGSLDQESPYFTSRGPAAARVYSFSCTTPSLRATSV